MCKVIEMKIAPFLLFSIAIFFLLYLNYSTLGPASGPPAVSTNSPSPAKSTAKPKSISKEVVVPKFLKKFQLKDGNFFDGSCAINDPSDIQVTLVTQLSVDRSWLFELLCERWSGPIIAVLYAKKGEWTPTDMPDICNHKLTIYPVLNTADDPNEYPVNELRNVAVSKVTTTHFLMVDADFLPDDMLYQAIISMAFDKNKKKYIYDPYVRLIANIYLMLLNRYQALVVPAFEYLSVKFNHDKIKQHIPHLFEQLKPCYHRSPKKCPQFHAHNSYESHHTTRTSEWFAKDQPRRIPCFRSRM